MVGVVHHLLEEKRISLDYEHVPHEPKQQAGGSAGYPAGGQTLHGGEHLRTEKKGDDLIVSGRGIIKRDLSISVFFHGYCLKFYKNPVFIIYN